MSTVNKNSMHGLTNFITEIRNCQSKEKEEKKVNKEMAKIRKTFKEGKDVDGYARRKYVSKLIYMYMLGYDIDFGYMEAVTLLSSLKFQEKLTGYLAISILLHENHEMLPLIIQSLQNDLQSRDEHHQGLALTAISNIGGKETAESLAPLVQKLLTSKTTKSTLKKKAAMCLLRLYRKYPELMAADVWAEKINILLDEHDHGILTSVMSLLIGLAADNPKGYESATKKVIQLLTKIVINKDFAKDYIYYNMANPWLQVKLLRFLSYYSTPEDSSSASRLNDVLKKILDAVDVAKGQTVNHKNALNAVLFEAIDLVVHLDDDRELIRKATGLLGRFVSSKEVNVRYLSLAAMARIATLDTETAALVKKHQEIVILALRDPDISIRKRALDLLYGMCDNNNAKEIVTELLSYLVSSEFGIREELVLKIAILAEKFAVNFTWYVDVILQMISLAGDYVSDDIWYRVVQIVTNHEDIQQYAAKTVFEVLQQPSCHETAVKVGGYILGEFGELIADSPASSPKSQFDVLQAKFPSVSLPTKALLLSTYVKMVNLYPELKEYIREIFSSHSNYMDAEIQQRACEYLKLINGSTELLQTVWEMMPAFPQRNNVVTDEHSGQSGQSGAQGGAVSSPGGSHSTDSPHGHSGTASHSKAVSPAASLLDDLLGLDSSAPAPTPVATNPVSATPAVSVGSPSLGRKEFAPSASTSELFGLGSMASATGAFGALSPPPVRPDAKIKVPLGTDGVLYQDEFIQIGYKSEFKQGNGRMMLFYGNVTSAPLTNFHTAISQVPAVTINVQQIPPVVEARAQAQQPILLISNNALDSVLMLNVTFNAGGRPVNINVPFPLAVCKFVEPLKLKGPDFFAQWNKLQGPPLEQQAIIKAPGPIDFNFLSTKLFPMGFNFSVLQGVDPNVNNLVAAGCFHASQTGVVNVLVRLETNPQAQMYRASLRTSDGNVTTAFKDLIVAQLS